MAEPTRAASSPGQARLNVGDLVYRTGDDRLWRVLADYDDSTVLIECVAEAWNRFKRVPTAELSRAS